MLANPNMVGRPPSRTARVGSTATADVGYTFTYELLVVYNLGTQPLTITAVRPVLTGHGLQYLGASLAAPDRPLGGADFMPAVPPADPVLGPMTPAVGAVLDPTADPHFYGRVRDLG